MVKYLYKNNQQLNISVVGLGYVGLSMAVLLAQHNKVVALDVDMSKVALLKERVSPITDERISEFLTNRQLNLTPTCDSLFAYKDADFIIIATPTDYDPELDQFNTSSIENVIGEILEVNCNATIVIKSTIPIGYVDSLRERFRIKNIFFSPEFLREGLALHDNLNPSRIIVGSSTERAKIFAELLNSGAENSNIPIIFMGSREAEAVKLFSNTYLAMRVAYINELDNYCISKDLDTSAIINGMSLDKRIGNFYNNPSFGYGGYCLPKDTKQLLSSFKGIPQNLFQAIVSSNETRMDFLVDEIITRNPKKIGFFRLTMKAGSDNFRFSAIEGIIKRFKKMDYELLIYEPDFKDRKYMGVLVTDDFELFSNKVDIILANRMEPELNIVKEKIYTRDITGKD